MKNLSFLKQIFVDPKQVGKPRKVRFWVETDEENPGWYLQKVTTLIVWLQMADEDYFEGLLVCRRSWKTARTPCALASSFLVGFTPNTKMATL